MTVERLLGLLVLALAIYAIARLFRRTTVLEHERALVYVDGRIQRVAGPGSYWHLASRTRYERFDMRTRYVSVAGQEVLSSDQVGLRVSLAARYAVADPQLAMNASDQYGQALHMELQLALREAVATVPMDELLARRAELGRMVFERAEPRAVALGLKLEAADVKDVMLPGDLKRIYAQVVKARQEGLAALERARGETAALRSLSNAARLAAEQPALLQLRLIQALSEGGRHTVMVGAPDGLMTPQRGGQPDSDA